MKIYFPTYIFIFCLVAVLAAQTENVKERQQDLQAIRNDINKYEKQLAENSNKLQAASDLVSSLNREIDMVTGHLSQLEGEIRHASSEINRHSEQIELVTRQIEELRELVKKRMVSFYKHGQRNRYKVLFSTSSVQQANVWLKYQKMIIENDQRNFDVLQRKYEQLAREKEQLIAETEQKSALLQEKQRESARLNNSRDTRQKYLLNLKDDAQYLASHLRELKAAQNQIGQHIQENERRRLKPPQPAIEHAVPQKAAPQRNYNFASLRGKLPWPVKGKVISHFGKQTHPTLKTVTENLGIEIQAALGTPVQAVDAGQVQTITWQRGRGNIIIIGHDDGYYTVYTHLAEINVNAMDFVNAGDIIGTVGDSGSLSGPVLHFQLWKNTQNLDPEKWLD